MDARSLRLILAGLVGGAVVGLFVGGYVYYLTVDFVLRDDDFVNMPKLRIVASRYQNAILLSLVIVFGAIGPGFTTRIDKRWVRHGVYGATIVIVFLVGVSFVVDSIGKPEPLLIKEDDDFWIGIVRVYAIPVILLFTPLATVVYGRWRTARQSCIDSPLDDQAG